MFSIAMTAWSAKVRTNSICRSVNGNEPADRHLAAKPAPLGLA